MSAVLICEGYFKFQKVVRHSIWLSTFYHKAPQLLHEVFISIPIR